MVKSRFLFLLLSCMLSVSLSANGTSGEEMIATESSTESVSCSEMSSQEDMTKSQSTDISSQQSENQSALLSSLLSNQDELVTQLENQFLTLQQQVQTLSKRYTSSKETSLRLDLALSSCKEKILHLESNLDEFQKALNSNKEDSGVLISEIASLYNKARNLELKISLLEDRIKRYRKWDKASIPVYTLSGIAIGAGGCLMLDNCSFGQYPMIAGAAVIAGFTIVKWIANHE